MKDHAIIPVFIPHMGCDNQCVFCNQHNITAKISPVTGDDVEKTITDYLEYTKNYPNREIAFYGGSFTGIPIDKQKEYLSIAAKYKNLGLVNKIHLSTRPDYINEEILENLKYYGVDIIELGAQSFDEKVLKLSKRGHNSQAIYKASDLIHEYGFELGLQLMIGLPGDSVETSIWSAKEAAKLKPEYARIYPTIVLDDTELSQMYSKSAFKVFTQDEYLNAAVEMYKVLTGCGAKVLRIGLKSTDLISINTDLGKSYHPAFGQMVESQIAKELILKEIEDKLNVDFINEKQNKLKIIVLANEKSINNSVGHKGSNKNFFKDKFPYAKILFKTDNSMDHGKYAVMIERN